MHCMYVWIEFLRQNRSGVTDRTGDRTDSKRQEGSRDRTDSKRQDRQQGTRQGLKVILSKMSEQDNTIMAGEGGLLSKIETGNANKSGGTGQEGRNRKERIDRKVEKIQIKYKIQEIKQNDNLNRTVKTERPRESDKNGTGRKSTYRTEQTTKSRQDSADRTAQTGENKQVRTTRIRKTGGENLIILSAHLCRQQREGFSL